MWYSLVKLHVQRFFLGPENWEMMLRMMYASVPVNVLLIRRGDPLPAGDGGAGQEKAAADPG